MCAGAGVEDQPSSAPWPLRDQTAPGAGLAMMKAGTRALGGETAARPPRTERQRQGGSRGGHEAGERSPSPAPSPTLLTEIEGARQREGETGRSWNEESGPKR